MRKRLLNGKNNNIEQKTLISFKFLLIKSNIT
jgi:hypothetical protein